ncbi:hypothetical protein CR513_49287, partial [Mucuna pruriens]
MIMKCVLRIFELASGLKVNFYKSSLLVHIFWRSYHYVLSCLPIYFLSLYKVPKKVIHSFTKIQKQFLWGNGEGRGNVAWVSLERVCKSKNDGELGILT